MKKTETETDLIQIGGRQWRRLPWEKISIARHGWLAKQMHEAGITKMVKEADESLADFFIRFTYEIMLSGRAYLLLAGFILPAGHQPENWSPQNAAEMARVLQQLYEDGADLEIQKLLAEIGASFLALSLRSTGDSAIASGSPDAGPGAAEPAPPSEGSSG